MPRADCNLVQIVGDITGGVNTRHCGTQTVVHHDLTNAVACRTHLDCEVRTDTATESRVQRIEAVNRAASRLETNDCPGIGAYFSQRLVNDHNAALLEQRAVCSADFMWRPDREQRELVGVMTEKTRFVDSFDAAPDHADLFTDDLIAIANRAMSDEPRTYGVVDVGQARFDIHCAGRKHDRARFDELAARVSPERSISETFE